MAIPQEILNRAAFPSIRETSQRVILAEVLDATERAQHRLLEQQADDGYWLGELEGDTILESEYVLLLAFLGLEKNKGKVQALARYILQKQEEHGGWGIYPGGPPDISASIKAYFALKLAGYSMDEPFMAKARELIRSLGGVDRANSFTKIYLAVLDQYPWSKCPAILPEIILFPTWFYFNIYAMSAWSRTIVVPLSLVWAYKPVIAVPCDISELYAAPTVLDREKWDRKVFSWKNFFLSVDKVIKALEKLPIKPLRKIAVAKAEKWICDRFQRSDGLGAIFPPMVNAVIALKVLGYPPDHPLFLEAVLQLEALEIEEGETIRIQPCLSPVWDTALAVASLHESGISDTDPSLQQAGEWLVSKEIKEQGADWRVTNPRLPVGGWAFEFNNEFYPDVDDSAMVLIALARLNLPEKKGAVARGLGWLLGLQGKDGGWAAFDRDNNHEVYTQVPFADHNAMLDPSCPDITGRVLEVLSAYGYTVESSCVQGAVEYLKNAQEREGGWYGRWGVNYIYGTWQVLKGLSCIGEDLNAPYVQRAAQWLRSVQNPDGGWGESCRSYEDPAHRGKGTSTPSQTAWGLMGLMAVGDFESLCFVRGLRWLLEHQGFDGSWEETAFTGTGFPKVFYLRYHLYRHYFPLFAFGMYLRKCALKEVY